MTTKYLANESKFCSTWCQTSGYLAAAVWHPADQTEASLYHCVMVKALACLLSDLLTAPKIQYRITADWAGPVLVWAQIKCKVGGDRISHWDSDMRSKHRTRLLGRLNLLSATAQEAMMHSLEQDRKQCGNQAGVISPCCVLCCQQRGVVEEAQDLKLKELGSGLAGNLSG